MDNTIERILIDNYNINNKKDYDNFIKTHLERYKATFERIKNKVVIDLACGVGYGTKLISENGAKFVIGVDVSEPAISFANNVYKNNNLLFLNCDYRELSLELIKNLKPEIIEIDLIISLETIEHLKDPSDFLNKLNAILKKDGELILSTPITPSMDANPFHLHDFTSKKIKTLLHEAHFIVGKELRIFQYFNPLKVRKEFSRTGLRKNLFKYYLSNPSKFLLRVLSTLRYGFKNVYGIYFCKKDVKT